MLGISNKDFSILRDGSLLKEKLVGDRLTVIFFTFMNGTSHLSSSRRRALVIGLVKPRHARTCSSTNTFCVTKLLDSLIF